jgi:hypothetical protein
VEGPGTDLTSLWLRARANANSDSDIASHFSSPLPSLTPSPPASLSGTDSRWESALSDETLTRELLDAVAERLRAEPTSNTPSNAELSKPKPLTAKQSKRQKDQKKGSKKRRQQKREVLGQRPGGKSLPSALALKTALRAGAVRTTEALRDIKTSHNGWMGSHGTKDVNDARDFSLEDVVGDDSEYKMKLIEYTGL